jgi:NarL family two-component system sensor histidine kinase YdfH
MKIRKSLAARLKTQSFEVPFFIFLTVVLSGMSVWVAANSPALRQPERLVVYGILVAAHILLYWLPILFADNVGHTAIYLAVQAGLAFSINLLAQNTALIPGLYLALLGITVGMLRITRQGVAAIAGLLGLMLLNYGLVGGEESGLGWPILILPMAAFVIIYVTLYNRQAEARTRAQTLLAELEAANRQLSEYAGQVEDLTLANERQRMARELHDTLSQGLAGLILQLEAVDAHLASARPERAAAIVQQAMLQARATLADARRAIGDLRQERLPDLSETLAEETARFSQASGVACSLEIDLPAPVPEGLVEVVQRSVAEGLSNIARHARASQAQVRLSGSPDWLDLTIHDNGIGFDPQAAASQAGHYGLMGIGERARLAGGTLEVLSQPGQGATLTIRLPLTPAE